MVAMPTCRCNNTKAPPPEGGLAVGLVRRNNTAVSRPAIIDFRSKDDVGAD